MIRSITFFLVLAFLTTACGQNNKKDYLVTIKTEHGDMVAILYDETPKHKENFIKLAKSHFYDSLLFHRVIQGFMIQGGDPDSKKAVPDQPLGTGGPGYTVQAEFVPKFFHEKGALSAARLGDAQNVTKESSGSQFYIVQGAVLSQADADNLKYDQVKLMASLRKMFENGANAGLLDSLNKVYFSGDMVAYQKRLFELVPRIEKATGTFIRREVPPERIQAYTTVGGAPHLDGDYTVFGKVIKGLDVIDKIAAVATAPGYRPVADVRMFVSVKEMSKKDITKEYGYVFPEVKK